MANDVIRVTAKAPVNVAVIKYWGKRDEVLILPLNDSVSATLSMDEMCSTTTVAVSKSFTQDKMWLNGKLQDLNNPRLQSCLKEIRRHARKRKHDENKAADDDMTGWHVHICSQNNFPTAAGLASSAAGYACLVFALGKLFKLNSYLSEIARRGSGSACRSIYGGFVQWVKGDSNDGSDSVATQICSEDHWSELRVLILVVSDKKKAKSSTAGMELSTNTSALLRLRAQQIVPERVEAIIKAIQEKDFNKFAEITMKDSNQLHAVCMDTYPPIRYMNDTSWKIVEFVHQYNNFYGKNKVAYTFDAGPNACLYLLEETVTEVVELIKYYFPPTTNISPFIRGLPVGTENHLTPELSKAISLEPSVPGVLQYVIHTKVGPGPQVLTDPSQHLLNEDGLPKYTIM